MSLYTFNNQTGSIPLSELDDNFSSVYAYVLSAGTANTANIANVAYSVSGANVTGNVNNAVYVTGNAQANVTSVGTLTSLSVSGNILTNSIILAGGNILTGSNISATGNVIGGNILTGSNISATGNIFGNFYNGNGSLLTGVIATGVGTLTNLSVTGNITSGNVSTGTITLGNGAVLKDNAGNAVSFGQEAGLTSQGTYAVAVGAQAGQTTQGSSAIAIGYGTGAYQQGNNAVAIGWAAATQYQGNNAVAIGAYAGESNQGNNSIIINATGATLDQTTANTFVVKPIRSSSAGNVLYYDNSTGEITYNIAVASSISNGTSNVSIPVANGNVIVNANDSEWDFNTNGELILSSVQIGPEATQDPGNPYYGEQTGLLGTRRVIAPNSGIANQVAWSTVISSADFDTPVRVFQASTTDVVAFKMTIRIQHGLDAVRNLQVADVFAAKDELGEVTYTVSNRIKTDITEDDVIIDADADEGNSIMIIKATASNSS